MRAFVLEKGGRSMIHELHIRSQFDVATCPDMVGREELQLAVGMDSNKHGAQFICFRIASQYHSCKAPGCCLRNHEFALLVLTPFDSDSTDRYVVHMLSCDTHLATKSNIITLCYYINKKSYSLCWN
jgi:hypothetical protein